MKFDGQERAAYDQAMDTMHTRIGKLVSAIFLAQLLPVLLKKFGL